MIIRSSKRLTRLALLPLALFLCPVSVGNDREFKADKAPSEIRIATWNLEWFFDDLKGNNRSESAKEQSAPNKEEWQWRLNMFAAAIAEFHPTILAVEEIEDRNVMQSLAKILKDRHKLDYRVAFVEGFDGGTEQDVAILCESGLVEYSRREQNQSMFSSKEFYNLSKHLVSHFEWQAGGQVEHLTLLVLHLRATADAADLRRKQAKLAHQWMRDRIVAGEKVIILGDLNVEEPAGQVTKDGDGMYDLLGWSTPTKADDLVDLLEKAPADKRRTHLILDKQFDRILVSPPLLESPVGLRFKQIEVLSQFNIRGKGPDEDHWDTRYTKDRDERDLSDHHPVMATFDFLVPK